MELWQACLILCPAAAIGGAINSIAGGGTLITFPALMWVLSAVAGHADGESIVANATNTVALFPGSMAGSWGYRRELKELWEWVRWLAIPSLLGGVAGSLIVVVAPEETFKAMIPWLIGLATALFILQPKLTRPSPVIKDIASRHPRVRTLVFCLQFIIGVYGGYFGAGIGILMLSSLSLLNLGTIHQVNALKTVLAGMINGISMVVFIANGKVHWPLALPMVVSAVIGGWLGAVWTRSLDKLMVRRIVIGIGLVLTVWYFGKQWAT
jgi:uncharacterized membrane protein YfcA